MCRLDNLLRHHVYVFPTEVVLAILQYSQVKRAQLITYLFEVVIVAAVPA